MITYAVTFNDDSHFMTCPLTNCHLETEPDYISIPHQFGCYVFPTENVKIIDAQFTALEAQEAMQCK